MTALRRMRRALILIAAGLLVQLLCDVFWSPLSFVLFASIGLPLVLAGSAVFLWTIYRVVDPLDAPLEEPEREGGP